MSDTPDNSPFDTTTKGINQSSLTLALDKFRTDRLFTPHIPGWDRKLRDTLYSDALGLAKGSEEQAIYLLLDFFAGTLGEMLWRAGDKRQKLIDAFNRYAESHESSFIFKLVLELAVAKSETMGEKNNV